MDVDLKEQGANLREIIKNEVNPETPLMIVHGSGVEPSDNISMLWEEFKPEELKKKEKEQITNPDEEKEKPKAKKEEKDDKNQKEKDDKDKEKEIKPRCVITTLNQDQWQNTRATLKDMAKVGGWVYVANTHLTLQSIPELEKTLDDIKLSNPHPNFKLIISTNPHPDYPISLLQRCNKITFELPKGIGNNMARLFDDLSKEPLLQENNPVNKYERMTSNNLSLLNLSTLLLCSTQFYWKEENIRDMDGQNSMISITVTLRYALIFFVPIANHMLILKISHGKQFKNL